MVLYKYRTNSERTEDIFLSNKLWFAKPETLNDPLECSIQDIAAKQIDRCVEEEKKAQISGLVFLYLGSKNLHIKGGRQGVENVMKKIGATDDVQKQYKLYSEYFKSIHGVYPSDPMKKYLNIPEILKKVGILSLSETCENELMWGHYADGGNGIAIGFDVPEKASITKKSICVKVNYSDEPIVLKNSVNTTLVFSINAQGRPYSSQTPSFDDPFMITAMSTKNTTWAYEKEWRCIEKTPGLKDICVPITEVVFGYKCSPETRKKYVDLAKKNREIPISFYEIILNGRNLEKRPYTIPE